MMDVTEIKGIGEKKKEILNSLDIYTVEDLIAACKTKNDIKELSKKSGVSTDTIKGWLKNANTLLSKAKQTESKTKQEQVKEVEEKKQPKEEKDNKPVIREPYWHILQMAGIKDEYSIVKYYPSQLLQLIYDSNIKYKCGVKSMPTINEIIYWINTIKSRYNV